jgi:hypothetical protein
VIRREETVFGIFPVLAGLSDDFNSGQQQFTRCSLAAEVPEDSDEMDVL